MKNKVEENVREIKYWSCPVCNTEHETKNDAILCHMCGVKLKNVEINNLNIELSNGDNNHCDPLSVDFIFTVEYELDNDIFSFTLKYEYGDNIKLISKSGPEWFDGDGEDMYYSDNFLEHIYDTLDEIYHHKNWITKTWQLLPERK